MLKYENNSGIWFQTRANAQIGIMSFLTQVKLALNWRRQMLKLNFFSNKKGMLPNSSQL